MIECINLISEEISKCTKSLKSEESHPGCSPDDSDDKIRDLKARIFALKQIREQLENL